MNIVARKVMIDTLLGALKRPAEWDVSERYCTHRLSHLRLQNIHDRSRLRIVDFDTRNEESLKLGFFERRMIWEALEDMKIELIIQALETKPAPPEQKPATEAHPDN